MLLANDSRIHPTDVATVGWWGSESMPRDPRGVKDWRGACVLPAHGELEVRVRNDLLPNGKAYGVETVEMTLRKLTEIGCAEERLLEGDLYYTSKKCAQKKVHDESIRVARQERAGILIKDMQSGEMHFNVVDFGGNFPLGTSTQRTFGEVERKERNRCVMMHLGSAMTWHTHGVGRCQHDGSYSTNQRLIKLRNQLNA